MNKKHLILFVALVFGLVVFAPAVHSQALPTPTSALVPRSSDFISKIVNTISNSISSPRRSVSGQLKSVDISIFSSADKKEGDLIFSLKTSNGDDLFPQRNASGVPFYDVTPGQYRATLTLKEDGRDSPTIFYMAITASDNEYLVYNITSNDNNDWGNLSIKIKKSGDKLSIEAYENDRIENYSFFLKNIALNSIVSAISSEGKSPMYNLPAGKYSIHVQQQDQTLVETLTIEARRGGFNLVDIEETVSEPSVTRPTITKVSSNSNTDFQFYPGDTVKIEGHLLADNGFIRIGDRFIQLYGKGDTQSTLDFTVPADLAPGNYDMWVFGPAIETNKVKVTVLARATGDSSITVLSPNGGEVWKSNSIAVDSLSSVDSRDQQKKIDWSPASTFEDIYGNGTDPAVIEVYLKDLNGNRVGRIPPFAYGSLEWVVGVINKVDCVMINSNADRYANHCYNNMFLVKPGNYYVEVFNRITKRSDTSDSFFTITASDKKYDRPTISRISSKGNADFQFYPGDDVTLTGAYLASNGIVRIGSTNIQLYGDSIPDNSLTFRVPSTIKPGTYSLYVHGPALTTNKVKVTVLARSVDSIQIPAAKPSITVLSPNGGERWITGQTYPIKWRTANLPAGTKVIFQLSYRTQSGITYEDGFDVNPIPNTGVFNWTVPAKYANMQPNYFKLRAILAGPNLPDINPPQDYSDNYFTITGASVTPSDSVTPVSTSTPVPTYSSTPTTSSTPSPSTTATTTTTATPSTSSSPSPSSTPSPSSSTSPSSSPVSRSSGGSVSLAASVFYSIGDFLDSVLSQ